MPEQPVADLTQAEAQQRSRLLEVAHYRLELDLRGLVNGTQFASRTTITFSCRELGASTWADLVAHDVTRVRINGVDVDPSRVVTGCRVALTDLERQNEVIIEAVHEETGRPYGLRRSVDSDDGAVYAWTHFEPFHARRVFACFDQPDLKASFSVVVLTPHDWTCVGNATVTQVRDDNPGRRWAFADTPRIPTYIVAIAAGPFHHVARAHGAVRLGLYARQALSEVLDEQAGPLLDITARGLDFYTESFGFPYGGDKLDQVYLPDFPAAMENFGCITYSDTSLFRQGPTDAQWQRRGRVQLHEIAHMWFGNLVTMPWWDGLWLKEAFANVATYLAAPTALGTTDGWAAHSITTAPMAYAADQSPATHPVHVPVPDVATAESVFDAITYHKGQSVVRQLLARLGEQTFLCGIRTYFARHATETADLSDLISALEEVAGAGLSGWVDAWIHQPGIDTIALRVDGRGTPNQHVAVTVASRGSESRQHHTVIGRYHPGQDGRLTLVDRVQVTAEAPATTIRDMPALSTDDVLLLNDGDLTFAKVRLDEQSLHLLLETGHTLPSPGAWAAGLTVVRDMVLDGELAVRSAVPHLLRLLASERSPALVSGLVADVHDMVQVSASVEHLDDLEARIAGTCLSEAETEPHGDRWLELALGAAAAATTSGQHDRIDVLLADGPEPYRNLRWAMLTRRVAVGVASEAEVRVELAADEENEVDALARAAIARAAQATEQAKEVALRELFTGRTVAPMLLGDLGSALWQRRQDELLRPYAQHFIDGLHRLSARYGVPGAGGVVAAMFPRAGLTHSLLDQAESMAASADLPRVVTSVLWDQIDGARRSLRARAS